MSEFFKSSTGMIITAFVLLVLGFILPFLMMMHILQSTLLLNFIAYIVSVGGLVLGVIGAALHFRPEEPEDDYYEH
jgi:hypothetical protein